MQTLKLMIEVLFKFQRRETYSPSMDLKIFDLDAQKYMHRRIKWSLTNIRELKSEKLENGISVSNKFWVNFHFLLPKSAILTIISSNHCFQANFH